VARAAAARATAPAPRRAPQRTPPRRKPAPARRRSTGRTAPARSARTPAGRRAKAAARLAAIPHSPFVDRLLTGRAWIVLVAALLAGIVFANVALLEKNAGIARTTEKVATLKRENSRLRLQAARLGSSERIQRAAADLGLVLPAPGEVRYLEARPEEDPELALKRMSEPEPVAVYTPPPAPAPVAETTPTTAAPVAVETAPTTTTEPVPAEPTAPTATTTPPAVTGQTG
jgi:cell division protein FtsL